MDEKTGVLLRGTGEVRINPYDKAALETAIRLKEKTGGEVTALTMGPASAKEVLKEAYAMGADTGILISDPAFAGADVFATSYTLAQAIRAAGPFECIICGRQTTDGDTAQTAPAIAAQLEVPCVSWVSKILSATEREITVGQQLTEQELTLKVEFPCVISVNAEIAVARIPALRRKIQAGKQEFPTLGLADMADKTPAHYGLEGSPTQVKKLFSPEQRPRGRWIEGTTTEIAAQLKKEIGEA